VHSTNCFGFCGTLSLLPRLPTTALPLDSIEGLRPYATVIVESFNYCIFQSVLLLTSSTSTVTCTIIITKQTCSQSASTARRVDCRLHSTSSVAVWCLHASRVASRSWLAAHSLQHYILCTFL